MDQRPPSVSIPHDDRPDRHDRRDPEGGGVGTVRREGAGCGETGQGGCGGGGSAWTLHAAVKADDHRGTVRRCHVIGGSRSRMDSTVSLHLLATLWCTGDGGPALRLEHEDGALATNAGGIWGLPGAPNDARGGRTPARAHGHLCHRHSLRRPGGSSPLWPRTQHVGRPGREMGCPRN